MPTAPTPPIKDIVISSEDPELIEILKEIKQTLDIREGRLGDTNFRFIDYYELIELLAGDETITITVLPGAHSHIHNDTTGKQGAGPEYYHLTAAEYGVLGTPPHNDTTGKQGGTAGEYYHLTLAELGALLQNIYDITGPPTGVAITNGSRIANLAYTAAGGFDIVNTNGATISLQAKFPIGGINNLFTADAGGFAKIFHVGGERLSTDNVGIQVKASGNSVLIGHQNRAGGPHGLDVVLYNMNTASHVFIDAVRTVGGRATGFEFDPDAGAGLFFNNVKQIDTIVDGVKIPLGKIETNTGTPIDLTIDCGTQKTVELAQGVWKDTNVGGAQLNPIPAFAPDLEKFLDEGGGDTGIYTLAFAVNESASGSFEIQHDYKEGTDISFHIHWQGIAAPTGTDFVKWELTYTIVRFDATIDASTVIVIETAIDTQYKNNTSVFPTISGSTGGNNGGPIKMGDQFLLTARRIAAAGDAYAGDALVLTAGLHYEVDTMGSRQIGVK